MLYGYEGLKRVEVAEAGRGRHRGGRRHRGHGDRRDARRPREARSRCRRSTSTSPRSPCSSPPTSRRSPGARASSSPPASSASGSGKETRTNVAHPGRGDRLARHLQGLRARRAPARDPHRDDAARGLRDGGRASPRSSPRRRTARRSSRWSTWWSTAPRSSSASSPRSSGRARARWSRWSNHGTGRVRLEYRIPSRGPDRLPLGVPHRHPRHRAPQPPLRRLGAAGRATSRTGPPARWWPTATGRTTAYAIDHLQPRGTLFVAARRAGLRGPGRRRERPRQRPRRQHHQGEEADQHARVHLGRGRAPDPAAHR